MPSSVGICHSLWVHGSAGSSCFWEWENHPHWLLDAKQGHLWCPLRRGRGLKPDVHSLAFSAGLSQHPAVCHLIGTCLPSTRQQSVSNPQNSLYPRCRHSCHYCGFWFLTEGPVSPSHWGTSVSRSPSCPARGAAVWLSTLTFDLLQCWAGTQRPVPTGQTFHC